MVLKIPSSVFRRGSYLKATEIPEEGRVVYLKEYGNVRVFRQLFKEAYRYYIMSVANLENLDSISHTDFKKYRDSHWQIECYHRALKQVYNIEKLQVRKSHAIRNHIYCSLRAFCKLEILNTKKIITNWYQIQRQLFNEAIAAFIKSVGIGRFINT